MRPLRSKILLGSLTAFQLVFCPSVKSEPTKPALAQGMTYNQVLALWGAPESKRELEAKRQDVWIYGANKVIFDSGKVVVWTGDRSKLEEKAADSPKQMGVTRSDPTEVSDLLSEIMREVPDAKSGLGSAAIPTPFTVPENAQNPS